MNNSVVDKNTASTSKKKNQNKNFRIHLNESSNISAIGENIRAAVAGDEITEPQNPSFYNVFGIAILGEKSATPVQVIERNISDSVTKEVGGVVVSIENASLTRF